MPQKLKTRRSTKKFFHLFFNGEVAEPQYFEGFNNLQRIRCNRSPLEGERANDCNISCTSGAVGGQKLTATKVFRLCKKVEMKKFVTKIFFILKLNQEIVFVEKFFSWLESIDYVRYFDPSRLKVLTSVKTF